MKNRVRALYITKLTSNQYLIVIVTQGGFHGGTSVFYASEKVKNEILLGTKSSLVLSSVNVVMPNWEGSFAHLCFRC
ncbi:hypothetical protein AKJ16_DCAP05092 [Drosera capensis]